MTRVTAANAAPVARGDHVLYWMIAARRTTWSHALDHAIARARELDRPLIVLEPLRAGYRWASDRLHAFVMQGMADNARAFARAGVTYLPYVEPEPGAGRGLLEALARRACLVITDEQPGFFLPRMVAAAAAKLPVRVEQVDGTGVVPLRAADRAYTTAASFRRHLQRALPVHLLDPPAPAPLARLPRALRDGAIPGAVLRRWRSATDLAAIPIDHDVAPVAYRGGAQAARATLDAFLAERLPGYVDQRATSGLSPYLHFGHLGAHEVVARTIAAADVDPTRLGEKPATAAEAFLDELITWRELGHGFCFHRADHDRYASLPDWARATLAKHAADPRPHLYSRAQLERAATDDPVWNAAQRQLVAEGRIHGYLRMLWGKKVIEWSRAPRAALATLIHLNNKYAVDGRDPNSWSGIFWCFGRFDHPWGPERPIFGIVRYLSSAQTRRKLRLSV